MAISLNEGSYGLLMDPSNGVADIEARLLRLVSNYGFLDNPALLIRATRLKARLGFELEERTQIRYENAKGDEMIEHLSARPVAGTGADRSRGRAAQGAAAPEAEGWTQHLFPAWTSCQGRCGQADRAARSLYRVAGAGRASGCVRRADAAA
jgi:tRNA nucleotidyltransferase (CCA-adding enzyme)